MSQTGLRFTLEVDGLEQHAPAVVRFTLRQHFSVPFMLSVDVADSMTGLSAPDFLEKNATLTLWQGTVPLRYISGLVAGVELREDTRWQMHYHLTIYPPLWRAGLRQNFRIFQQQDIRAISATLLEENGITDWVARFYEPHPAREFCVQYGETDLAFLTRLWAEEGIFFFEQFAADGPAQTLMLTDDVAGVVRTGTVTFNPDTRRGVAPGTLPEFRYRAQIRPSSVENQDYTFKAPRWTAFFSYHARELNGQRTQYEIFDYPGRFKDEPHGQSFARYQAEGWRNNAETASAMSLTPAQWPGMRFTLEGHPSDALNREWQVTGCLMQGEQPQAQHGSRGPGTTLENRFEVMPGDRTWRATPLLKPRVDGPQSAVVVGPPGEEIFCDKYGRVRVSFHWDRYCPGNEDSSCWVRVSQAWAGAGFGNVALPRVGHEVIVDFLNGDPDQPIIMGRTYHDENRAPGRLPDTRTQMTIRSKTYKGDGFNELRFEDATSNEQIYIHAQKDMDTEVLNNRTTDVKVDHTETIGNNQKINVGLTQTVTVGKENAAGHDQRITVAHDRNISVRNDQTLTVTHDRRVSTGHDDGLYVANDRKVTVDGKQEHRTTGDHLSRVDGTHSLVVKGDQALKVTGASGTRAQGEIVLQSDTQITLRVGGSFVVIHPGGVDIVGPKINLNSGGSPGIPVGVMLPSVLKALVDGETPEDQESPQDDGNNSGNAEDEASDDQEEPDDDDNYYRQFNFTNDDGVPYTSARYLVRYEGGSKSYGITDQEGQTERFIRECAEIIDVRLLSQNIDMTEGGVDE